MLQPPSQEAQPQKRRKAPSRDRCWSLPSELPDGWEAAELEPAAPTTDSCFAALFHGDSDEYFVYACVLGRSLRSTSSGPDRVLLCGPGRCREAGIRKALRAAGWDRLLPVCAIPAAHLDRTKAKRHALVFTKLRVLELPYRRVLLLDLDLLPRETLSAGECEGGLAQLLRLPAPAAKYQCAAGAQPEGLRHGETIPPYVQEGYRWSPNAGVIRLDPLPGLQERQAQVAAMVEEVAQRQQASYLPEQYYLAERLSGWRHIDKDWNWEVWPEWDDPGFTHPVQYACQRARSAGWAGYYGNTPECPRPDTVLKEVKVWHFSGRWETAPWMFQDSADTDAVRASAVALFRFRDPGAVVATAVVEWRRALEQALMAEGAEISSFGGDDLELGPLRLASDRLAQQATQRRQQYWWCDSCEEPRARVRCLEDVPLGGKCCSVDSRGLKWVCVECIVRRLRAASHTE